MTVLTISLLWRLTIYLLAGIAGGVSNGIAGGGTFIIFPTMLALGIPALQANESVSVGVVPSFIGGIRGFRHELREHWPLVRTLLPSCLLGTVVGCVILLTGTPSMFRTVVPWLIGGATALFALSPLITRWLANVEHSHPGRKWSLLVSVFLVSIYGGYFGAGLGILLLAVLAISLPFDMAEIQGIRVVLSIIISSVAAIIFIFRGHLALEAVYVLLVGTLIGGWLGTLLIRRLSPTIVRALVIATGLFTTVRLFLPH